MSGPTRGSGLLEGFLARRRTAQARRLLPLAPDAAILDIGCGSTPLFLRSVTASRRVGIDRLLPPPRPSGGIEIVVADAASSGLPFKDRSFDAVTMLAVLEHLPPDSLPGLIGEVHRVLKAPGRFVLTTPPPRTDVLLKWFAKLHLVSPEEIDEHAKTYTTTDLKALLSESPFADRVETGTFELKMNQWVTALRSKDEHGTS